MKLTGLSALFVRPIRIVSAVFLILGIAFSIFYILTGQVGFILISALISLMIGAIFGHKNIVSGDGPTPFLFPRFVLVTSIAWASSSIFLFWVGGYSFYLDAAKFEETETSIKSELDSNPDHAIPKLVFFYLDSNPPYPDNLNQGDIFRTARNIMEPWLEEKLNSDQKENYSQIMLDYGNRLSARQRYKIGNGKKWIEHSADLGNATAVARLAEIEREITKRNKEIETNTARLEQIRRERAAQPKESVSKSLGRIVGEVKKGIGRSIGDPIEKGWDDFKNGVNEGLPDDNNARSNRQRSVEYPLCDELRSNRPCQIYYGGRIIY